MIIGYESSTGFTKRYAEMLSAKTGMKLFRANELSKTESDEEIVFLGWLKAGKIQGFKKVRKFNVVAICGTGMGSAGENCDETINSFNRLGKIPFFYAQGGCLPLKDLKGMDKFFMSIFIKILKKQKDEKNKIAVDHIENGFDEVKEENLNPLIEWLNTKR